MKFKVGDKVRFTQVERDHLNRGCGILPGEPSPYNLVYTVKWIKDEGFVTIQFGEGIPTTSGVVEVSPSNSWAWDWHENGLEKVEGEPN